MSNFKPIEILDFSPRSPYTHRESSLSNVRFVRPSTWYDAYTFAHPAYLSVFGILTRSFFQFQSGSTPTEKRPRTRISTKRHVLKQKEACGCIEGGWDIVKRECIRLELRQLTKLRCNLNCARQIYLPGIGSPPKLTAFPVNASPRPVACQQSIPAKGARTCQLSDSISLPSGIFRNILLIYSADKNS
jgi:hypothetical protein